MTGASWWVEKASDVVTFNRPCGVPLWPLIWFSSVSISPTIRRAVA